MRRRDKPHIYAAGSNAHCGYPRYNHARKKNKTNTKTDKKSININLVFLHLLHQHQSIFNIPLFYLHKSALGGEAGFRRCSHADDDRAKQEMIKKNKIEYNTEYNKSRSSLCNSLLKEDSISCIRAHSDNEFMKKASPYLQFASWNHNLK